VHIDGEEMETFLVGISRQIFSDAIEESLDSLGG